MCASCPYYREVFIMKCFPALFLRLIFITAVFDLSELDARSALWWYFCLFRRRGRSTTTSPLQAATVSSMRDCTGTDRIHVLSSLLLSLCFRESPPSFELFETLFSRARISARQ